MEVEIIDRKLVITPLTLDELQELYALAAAWTAFMSVMRPISGEPLRCNEEDIAESGLLRRHPESEPEP